MSITDEDLPNYGDEGDVMATVEKMRKAGQLPADLAEAFAEVMKEKIKAVGSAVLDGISPPPFTKEADDLQKLLDTMEALEYTHDDKVEAEKYAMAELEKKMKMDAKAALAKAEKASTPGAEPNAEQVKILKILWNIAAASKTDKDINFGLETPSQLTIKNKDGGYRKSSFIGGEQLILVDAYAGKRDGVICVFEEVKDMMSTLDPGMQIEIPVSNAMMILSGFRDAYNQLTVSPATDSVTGDYNVKVRSRDNPGVEDELAGSW